MPPIPFRITPKFFHKLEFLTKAKAMENTEQATA